MVNNGAYRWQQGASKLELVVVIVLVVSLGAVAYVRIAQLTENVERTDFTRTLNRVQAQLTLAVADWYGSGKAVARVELEQTNPMQLIEVKPENYAGERVWNDLNSCPLASWCFITDKHWLMYRVKHTGELNNRSEYPDILFYQLSVNFAQPSVNQGLAVALTLKPVKSFQWQGEVFD